MDDKTRVGVAGFGYWGRNLVRNFHDLGALAAVCDSSPENLALCREQFKAGRYYSRYADMLADKELDAVVIATPAESHGAMVRQALSAGKDVFVEKPLCLEV